MSKAIKTVAVAGATGNTGPQVVQALLDDRFDVTALARSSTAAKSALGKKVKVAQVDYHSHDSLVEALHGVDAVAVCGVSMLPEQTNLIDAAIAAGVTRFMPAGFAADLRDEPKRDLQISKDSLTTREYLEARKDRLSSTSICTGPLFDWVMARGVLIDMKARSQRRYDDGEKRVSTTTVATAAKAVASALKLGEKSANRTFCVQDAVITQNELLRLAKEIDPSAEWPIQVVDTKQLGVMAEKAFEKDPNDRMAAIMQRGYCVFGEQFVSDFGKADNEELGLREMSEAQIKELLKSLT